MPLTVFTPIVYGAHPGTISGVTHTGGFTIDIPVTSPSGLQSLVGDTDVLTGAAVGGGNTLTLTGGDQVTVIGDALTVTGSAHAGNNTIEAGSFGTAGAAGDAVTMGGSAVGGHNTISVGARGDTFAYGDAVTMGGQAQGGHNTLTGGSGTGFVNLFGDAETMSGFAQGGDNMLVGERTNPSIMYGDAMTLSGFAKGGGNTLIAPSDLTPRIPTNTLYGDGHDLLGFASGGGNTLISGNSNDIMWGDAAVVAATAHTKANTFVFSPPNGQDVIMDFHPGRDHIDLQGYGFNSFTQVEALFQQTAKGLDIVFDAADSILLSGVNQNQVSAGDFVFS
jgi:Ca2+-binding RTX toxin-like protein